MKAARAAAVTKRTMAEKVIGFTYDNATTGSEAPVTFGVIPGIWTPGETVLPSAFGMSLEQMREAVKTFNLPLRESRVAEKDAVAVLDRGLNHLPTEDSLDTQPEKPSADVIETDGGPIPAAAPTGAHRPLLPLAAAMQARNTALSNGEPLEAAAAAARAAGGEWGEGLAEAAESAAARNARAADDGESPANVIVELTDDGGAA